MVPIVGVVALEVVVYLAAMLYNHLLPDMAIVVPAWTNILFP